MELSRNQFFRITQIALAFVAGTFLAGCATNLSQPITGSTCCNLRPDYGWLSGSNVLGGPILPAGEPVLIDTIQRDKYFYGTLGGDYISLRDDAVHDKGDAMRWIRQIIVPTGPKVEFSTWGTEVQSAIYSAKVFPDMTRPQVLMALSYPSRTDTKDLNAKSWRYWTAAEDEPVDVNFDADGKVTGFSGKPAAVRAIEFRR